MPLCKPVFYGLFLFLIAGFSDVIAQDDYQKWLEKEQKQFNQFLEEEDRAFSDFLKKDWEAFQTNQGMKADKAPKPPVMPVVQEKDKPQPPPVETVKPVPPVKLPEKKPEPKPKPKPVTKKTTNLIQFQFYGAPVSVNYKKDFEFSLTQPINNTAISAAWEVMAKSNHKLLVEQLLANKKQLALNDWGYLKLVGSLGQQLFPQSSSEQNLFCWFVMTKSGYDAKVAYKNEAIYLLLPNEHLIYENRFIVLNDKKYYFISLTDPIQIDGQIFTYAGQYQGSDKLVRMSVDRVPNLVNKIESKQLNFSFQGKEYTIPVQFDHDMVTFFKNYPQTELRVYFEAAISSQAQYSLAKSLKPYLDGLSELDAVNFLLRFAQSSFEYKTDDSQFGREKYLMVEETLFYPGSDCEDRSILFAYLVRNLLGLQVIGLDYPGHIATAVQFRSEIGGDYLMHQGDKYIVCDPTYVNADAGMTMPQYKTVAPVVIEL